MGSSSGQTQSTTTQNLTPEQQSLVGLSMPGYQQFAANTATPATPQVAGFTPSQVTGQQMTLNAAGQMQPVLNTAAGTNQYLSSGAFLDPGSNPYVQNAVKAATQPIYQNLAETTQPATQAAGAAGSGVNFGGSREGIAEAQNVRNANITAGNVGAGIENTALGQGLAATGQAVAQAPATAASLTQPGAVTSAVGETQQQQQQNVLNATQQQQLMAQLWPLLQSQYLTQAASATPGGSASTTGQTTQNAAPWQIAAGLMAGAGSLFGGKGGGLLSALGGG